MGINDPYFRFFLSGIQNDQNIEYMAMFNMYDFYWDFVNRILDFLDLRFIDSRNHFKTFFRVSGNYPCQYSDIDSSHVACIRNYYRLNIFYDASTEFYVNMIRIFTHYFFCIS